MSPSFPDSPQTVFRIEDDARFMLVVKNDWGRFMNGKKASLNNAVRAGVEARRMSNLSDGVDNTDVGVEGARRRSISISSTGKIHFTGRVAKYFNECNSLPVPEAEKLSVVGANTIRS
jgi:hypothetical protein